MTSITDVCDYAEVWNASTESLGSVTADRVLGSGRTTDPSASCSGNSQHVELASVEFIQLAITRRESRLGLPNMDSVLGSLMVLQHLFETDRQVNESPKKKVATSTVIDHQTDRCPNSEQVSVHLGSKSHQRGRRGAVARSGVITNRCYGKVKLVSRTGTICRLRSCQPFRSTNATVDEAENLKQDGTFKAIDVPRPLDFDVWFACFTSVVSSVHASVSSSNVRSHKNVTQCGHSCRTGCILERVSLLIRQFPTYGLREFSRTHIAWLSGTALAACVFRGPAVLCLNHLVFAKFPGRLLQGRLVHLVEENAAPSRQLGPWRERGE